MIRHNSLSRLCSEFLQSTHNQEFKCLQNDVGVWNLLHVLIVLAYPREPGSKSRVGNRTAVRTLSAVMRAFIGGCAVYGAFAEADLDMPRQLFTVNTNPGLLSLAESMSILKSPSEGIQKQVIFALFIMRFAIQASRNTVDATFRVKELHSLAKLRLA